MQHENQDTLSINKGMFNTIAALWHHGFSAQWRSLKSSIHSTTAYSKFSCTMVVVSKFGLPNCLKVDYKVTLQMRSVMPSIHPAPL